MQERDRLPSRPSYTDASKQQPDQKRSFRMLAAYMDLGACYKLTGGTQRASAELRGLHIESQVSVGGRKVQISRLLRPQFSVCLMASVSVQHGTPATRNDFELCPELC